LSKPFRHAGLAMKHQGEDFDVLQNTVYSQSYKMKKPILSSPPPYPSSAIPSSIPANRFSSKEPHHEESQFPKIEASPAKISAVRLNLHPTIDKDCAGDEFVWVPGLYSKRRKMYSEKRVIRVGREEEEERRGGGRAEARKRKEEEEGGEGKRRQFVSYSKVGEGRRVFLFDYDKEIKLNNKEGYRYREEQKEKWLSRTFKF
jgi:hypothetical protein